MTLQDFKKQYDELEIKKNLSGDEALKAVKQELDDLQYLN